MLSDGRRALLIKATTGHRESNFSSSPHCPQYQESHHSESEKPILLDKSKKDKPRRIASLPMPPSPKEHHQSTTQPSPSPLSASPRPREKRRRSSSPPKPESKRPVSYDDLHSYFPPRSSQIRTRICDNYGCGRQHSHDDCPLPMRCRGCHSTLHFAGRCHQVCGKCGYTGHNQSYCSDFWVGRDGKSRPVIWSRYMILLSVQACPQESADIVFKGVLLKASTTSGRRITISEGFGRAPTFARSPIRLSPAPQHPAL